jgi:hypothetical protein
MFGFGSENAETPDWPPDDGSGPFEIFDYARVRNIAPSEIQSRYLVAVADGRIVGVWPDFRADLPQTQRDGSGRCVARARRHPGSRSIRR